MIHTDKEFRNTLIYFSAILPKFCRSFNSMVNYVNNKIFNLSLDDQKLEFMQHSNFTVSHDLITISSGKEKYIQIISVVYNMGGIKTFCPPETYVGPRVLKHFWIKNFLIFWSKYLNQFSIKIIHKHLMKFKIFINFGLRMFQYLRTQSVSISPYYILPSHFYNSSIKTGSIFFLIF